MLHNWFTPLNTSQIINDLPFDDLHLGEHILMHKESFPDLNEVKIAIIGIGEQSDLIRTIFYRMQIIPGNINIADLGNLVNTKENTIKVVLTELIAQNILPIVIGLDTSNFSDCINAQNSSSIKDQIHPLFVDEKIAFGKSVSRSYLNPIVESKKTISELSVLAYQMHYSNNGLGNDMQIPFHSMRLGQIKSSIIQSEPYIRDVDCLIFMMSALKHAEAPAQFLSNPSGLFSEEACQICRYAGLSNNIKQFVISGFDLSHDNHNQTSEVISQMMWYFILGYANRYSENQSNWIKYLISIEEEQEQFIFYKSNISGRWWVSNNESDMSTIRACSYEDYLSSIKNHISDRLLDLFH